MFDFFKKWYGKFFFVEPSDKITVNNDDNTEQSIELTPKEYATTNNQPWVAVLDTHVNPENPRNGFFELDWNEHFIAMLRSNGYTGGSDEEIVDGWFQDLCREIGGEEKIMMDRRFSGYINVNNLGNGKSEVS